jgi:hypothetical protein
MANDNLQLQRFELKYLVREETARRVREFISSYLEIDEFGATQPNFSYPIHSLYLDSDALSLYWHTINGNKNRFKLRLRFYDGAAGSPVYFEIKRRMNDAILKQRGAVRRECVDWLLAGHLPDQPHLISPEPKDLVALQRFCQLMNEHQARPKAHVAYLREAWISPHNNAVRVTMDRHVRCEPDASARLSTEMNNPVVVFGKSVILELKFTGHFPDWFRELVRIFNLAQCSAAKYADGVALLGEGRFSEGLLLPQPPQALDALKVRRDFLVRNGAECLKMSVA